MKYLRVMLRAFEMSMKMRVINAFWYLSWLVFPLIFSVLGLILLSPGGSGRSAYAILGGGLIAYWGMAYLEGGNNIQDERWSGTLEQLMGCPTPIAFVVIGKLASSLAVGILAFLPGIALAYFGFHQSLHHIDPIPFAVSFAVLTFSFFSTAMALAPVYTLWRWAFALTNGFEIGLYVICGFMFPITQLPGWLQVMASALAPSWATRALYAATGQSYGRDYLLWWAISIALSCAYLFGGWIGFRLVDVRARVSGQLALA